MKIYLVGGAVRDHLLGLPIKERDYVVVGADSQALIKLGFKQVGKDFPVFLHPETNEEYALARMERKTKAGYAGFQFDVSSAVSLKEDLLRRDLTINAMAMDEDGNIIDPYHGQQDLQRRLLRHVSRAFVEDPVRVLRIARFLARYHDLGFVIAPETLNLMQKMVSNGEIDALVAERVWKEMVRALEEPAPEQFFYALDAAHALQKLFPELTLNSFGLTSLRLSKHIAQLALVRYAVLTHDLSDQAAKTIAKRFKLPNHYQDLSRLVIRFYHKAIQWQNIPLTSLLELLNGLDVTRRMERFCHFLTCCQMIAHAKGQSFNHDLLFSAAQAIKAANFKAVLDQKLSGPELAAAVAEIKLATLKTWFSQLNS